jgi:hypothetical protein
MNQLDIFIHLAVSDITVYWPLGIQVFPYVDLERSFPTQMYRYLELYPNLKNIGIINWPWSFTSLRIACLSLNLIQLWRNQQLDFYVSNKLDLYHRCYSQWWFAKTLWVWIWQQKNHWIVDIPTKTYQKELIADLPQQINTDYEDRNFPMKNIITYDWDSECKGPMLKYWNEQYQVDTYFLQQKPVKFISPDYMVEL